MKVGGLSASEVGEVAWMEVTGRALLISQITRLLSPRTLSNPTASDFGSPGQKVRVLQARELR